MEEYKYIYSVHCADCTIAHEYGSQSTTYTYCLHHSTEPYSRQQFLTYILYSSLAYHLTGILTKTI